MARKIAEIQEEIIDAKESEAALAGLSSNSKVAIWRLWTYVVAVCIWTLENLFDAHKAEVATAIDAQKPHTLQWYAEMAKKFQTEGALPDGSHTYEPIIDEPTVRIVTYAAVVEMYNKVYIKVAKGAAGDLGPLSPDDELIPFKEYMHRIKDAGVRLAIISEDPDELRLTVAVYYDPLVLDSLGRRLDDDTVKPVEVAIHEYLKNLPFNGLFVVNRLIDAMENAAGVRIAMVNGVDIDTAEVYDDVSVKYTPLAGYLKFISAESTITYQPFES